MSVKRVLLFWAIGEEWGYPPEHSEIFAAETEEQAVECMSRFIKDESARAVRLSNRAMSESHQLEDGRTVTRLEALKIDLDRGEKAPFYFETIHR